jgi:hypothetical protein
MDTWQACALSKAATVRGDKPKVFDWLKAAKILKERKPKEAYAGLSRDLEWTAGCIYRKGKPITDESTYLRSTWATPVLVIGNEEIPCFVDESSTQWNEETKWPEEALKILAEP